MPDGRSIVKTKGVRKFRTLSVGEKDGYSTAEVEWWDDIPDGSDDSGNLMCNADFGD